MLPNVGVYAPRLIVEFHTPNGMYRAVKVQTDDPKEALRQDILLAGSEKTIQAPAGGFTINLTGRKGTDGKRWIDRISPQDLAVVKMQRFNPADPTSEDSRERVIMVGPVDSVFENEDIGDSDPQHVITVQGRDFGKLFLKAVQKFFPADARDQAALAEQIGLQHFLQMTSPSGTPAYLIAWCLTELLFKNLTNLSFTVHGASGPSQAVVSQILRFALASAPELVPIVDPSMFAFEGPIWNFMKSVVNEPFYELFCDIRDEDIYNDTVLKTGAALELTSNTSRFNLPSQVSFGATPAVFFRPTPFDTAAWESLTNHTIDRTKIRSYSLGKSDHEHYNVFHVAPLMQTVRAEDYRFLVPPKKSSEETMKKYGVNVLEVGIRAIDMADYQIDTSIKLAQDLQEKLQVWYGENEKYESGQLLVQGNGKYRVGQRIDLPWRNRRYYLESVTHNFPLFGQFLTTLSLTRGH